MRDGWGARASKHRAATALVVLTLVPVAALIGSAPSQAPSVPSILLDHASVGVSLRAQDYVSPTAEALRRGEASGLFAPFTFNGETVFGPFALFGYQAATGRIYQYSAVGGGETLPLIEEIDLQGFSPTSPPSVTGATFAATGSSIVITAHDEPMVLLELRSLGAPTTVVLRLPGTATTVTQLSHSASWPQSSLAFSVGESRGRLILGAGTFNVTGTTIVASLKPWDYLAMKAVPAFAEHRVERTAVLDAFASGRLAAEYALVASTDGGWVENSADYRASIDTSSQGVVFNRAAVEIGDAEPQGGVVILSFDGQTMPADAGHQLVVRLNGTAIAEISDAVGPLYAAPNSLSQPVFARLSMNATVLVVYLPTLQASPLEVESLVVPAPVTDAATLMAMITGVAVVSVAAAEMFRRREPD